MKPLEKELAKKLFIFAASKVVLYVGIRLIMKKVTRG